MDPLKIINDNGALIPWAVCDRAPNPMWVAGYTVHGQGKRVADVADHYFPETAIVVANLIAAAPEMMLALEMLVASHEDVDSGADIPLHVYKEAKAALAKARGEQPT